MDILTHNGELNGKFRFYNTYTLMYMRIIFKEAPHFTPSGAVYYTV